MNFFDTANTSGHLRAEGVTESIFGDWLGGGQERRDRIVLATKLYGGKGEWPYDRFLSAVNIRQACEASLRRLRTDRQRPAASTRLRQFSHTYLYQVHHVERELACAPQPMAPVATLH